MYFDELNRHSHQLAVIDGERHVTYAQLQQLCDEFAELLPAERSLLFVKADNSLETLVAYLSGLQKGHVQLLLDPQLDDSKFQRLKDVYNPQVLVEKGKVNKLTDNGVAMSPELALLLSTSGSTGSPKQVCLSLTNLHSNAQAICKYLPITADDRTITTLPFFYSYGLSIINSHLNAGACIVMSGDAIISREFWNTFKAQSVTSFGGVPYSYEMLLRLRFTRMELPSLRYFTQAGGKLGDDKVQQLAEYAAEQGKQFYVMYGQTEATARMAYLSPDKLPKKASAIGQAIPGGKLWLVDDKGNEITQKDTPGELLYSGDNIMLGYAEALTDLAAFKQSEQLHTGDLAYSDKDGDFVICGRLKRFIKPFGQRINLADVEQWFADKGLEAFAVGSDNKLQIAIKKTNKINELSKQLSQYLQLHPSAIVLMELEVVPVTSNGKTDYVALQEWFDGL